VRLPKGVLVEDPEATLRYVRWTPRSQAIGWLQMTTAEGRKRSIEEDDSGREKSPPLILRDASGQKTRERSDHDSSAWIDKK